MVENKAMTSRQGFLGAGSDAIFADAQIGVVGLGGGGSHIVQQLAHIGISHLRLFDPDSIDPEGTNLNRLVGATATDVRVGTPKTAIAARLVLGINPSADLVLVQKPWQESIGILRNCDVIVGCVDTFRGRQELERAARRFHIPYIDIGMDVHAFGDDYLLTGQVFLSLPGDKCMTCFGLLREDLLALEASRYGAAGIRQQVIWPNGVLASTAVGLVIRLLAPWSPQAIGPVLLEYDGNRGTVVESTRMGALKDYPCSHFQAYDDIGDPFWTLSLTQPIKGDHHETK
ncbi:MAG: thiamine/molybdopterin biosynthesis protein [Planctomycetaceae bacterium]|nr:thiamine/molybdopterin biosynthesis protein [Planctomycetaceae bacterium]